VTCLPSSPSSHLHRQPHQASRVDHNRKRVRRGPYTRHQARECGGIARPLSDSLIDWRGSGGQAEKVTSQSGVHGRVHAGGQASLGAKCLMAGKDETTIVLGHFFRSLSTC
jgi:hypothetical protein